MAFRIYEYNYPESLTVVWLKSNVAPHSGERCEATFPSACRWAVIHSRADAGPHVYCTVLQPWSRGTAVGAAINVWIHHYSRMILCRPYIPEYKHFGGLCSADPQWLENVPAGMNKASRFTRFRHLALIVNAVPESKHLPNDLTLFLISASPIENRVQSPWNNLR